MKLNVDLEREVVEIPAAKQDTAVRSRHALVEHLAKANQIRRAARKTQPFLPIREIDAERIVQPGNRTIQIEDYRLTPGGAFSK